MRNVPFGDVIHNKEDVVDRIRRAQLAILHPSRESVAGFLKDDEDDTPGELEIGFSSNKIELDISGPELADLSFIDLPGTKLALSSIPFKLELYFLCRPYPKHWRKGS